MTLERIHDLDWSACSEPMAREIVAKAEMYLQAQLQAGIAADQRAMTLAGMFIAAATAIAIGVLAVWQTTSDLQLLIGGAVSSAVLTGAAAFCMWAARAIEFYYPGNEPENWFSCRDGDIVEALGGEAENYEPRIAHNKGCLNVNAKALNRGIKLAILAPVLAALAWIATGFIFPSSPPPTLPASPIEQSQPQ